eukprot:jgi/Hompol1/2428/HPOL_002245-RA
MPTIPEASETASQSTQDDLDHDRECEFDSNSRDPVNGDDCDTRSEATLATSDCDLDDCAPTTQHPARLRTSVTGFPFAPVLPTSSTAATTSTSTSTSTLDLVAQHTGSVASRPSAQEIEETKRMMLQDPFFGAEPQRNFWPNATGVSDAADASAKLAAESKRRKSSVKDILKRLMTFRPTSKTSSA